MSVPEDAIVAVVGPDDAARAEIVSIVASTGAAVEACTLATAITRAASGVDAAVLDARADFASLAAIARALLSDANASATPCVVLVPKDATVEALGQFGAATFVPSNAPPERLQLAIARSVAHGRAAADARRAAETARAQIVATQRKLTTLSEQVGNAAHDVRALVNIVVGYAANLRDGIAGPLDELQLHHVANVLQAANDASGLLDRHAFTVKELLTASQAPLAPAGTASLRRAAPRRRLEDVGEMLRATVALFEGPAASRPVVLTVETGVGLSAWCDATQLKQLLVNLLANAVKFTPPHGHVHVIGRSGAPGSTRGQGARRTIEIIVHDSGPGIPADDRGRVFQRGERLERDQAKPGSGLGLAVVAEIVASHGGTVQVEDGPAGGAAFVVSLPIDQRKRNAEGVLVIRDASAATTLRDALGAPRASELVPRGVLARLLADCAAVLVLPEEENEGFDALLRAATSSTQGGHGRGSR